MVWPRSLSGLFYFRKKIIKKLENKVAAGIGTTEYFRPELKKKQTKKTHHKTNNLFGDKYTSLCHRTSSLLLEKLPGAVLALPPHPCSLSCLRPSWGWTRSSQSWLGVGEQHTQLQPGLSSF